MPSVFIHVPSLFFLSDLQLQREERERRRERQKQKCFPIEMRRVKVLLSWAEAVTAQFKTLCHAKQPKAPKTCKMTSLWTSGKLVHKQVRLFKTLKNIKNVIKIISWGPYNSWWQHLNNDYYLKFHICVYFYLSLSMKIIVSFIGKHLGVHLS